LTITIRHHSKFLIDITGDTFKYKEQIKALPGTRWIAKRRAWCAGKDLVPIIKKLGPAVEESDKAPPVDYDSLVLDPRLHPFQVEGVEKILQQDRAYMLAWSMGLGKSPAAVHALRYYLKPRQTALIVCPALVRDNWMRELDNWWPDHPPAFAVHNGKDQPPAGTAILIISYNLAPLVVDEHFDYVIIDESQMVKNPATIRTKTVSHLTRSADFVLALTATPLEEAVDLYAQADILFPSSVGRNKWEFAERYARKVPNKHAPKGYDLKGLADHRSGELQLRLSTFVHRVVKQEVAHLLPPFNVVSTFIKPKRAHNPRELSELLSSGERKQHELNAKVETGGAEKITYTVDALEQALDAGEVPAAAAWYKKTAKALFKAANKKLGRRADLLYIDGDIPTSKRMNLIEAAKKSTRPTILIGTMASMEIGIDLTHWTHTVVTELYWRAMSMIQFLGRFSRLSGILPSTVNLLVLEGTLDEVIAMTLERRLKEAGQLLKEGLEEDKLLGSLSEDDEAWQEALREEMKVFVEEDEYL
jgi:superfamily II DNA or RNA helicase